jgi:hypothetical protein
LILPGPVGGSIVQQIVIPNEIEGRVKELLYPDLQNQRKAAQSKTAQTSEWARFPAGPLKRLRGISELAAG